MYVLLLLLLIVALGAYAMKTQLTLPGLGPSDKVKRMAEAIALAEGWYRVGSLPYRMNNPGALRLFGETGTITQFPTPEEGWNALYRQVEGMLSGTSLIYSPSMSLYEAAQVYTGGDNPEAWANIVAGRLGVTTDITLAEYARS